MTVGTCYSWEHHKQMMEVINKSTVVDARTRTLDVNIGYNMKSKSPVFIKLLDSGKDKYNNTIIVGDEPDNVLNMTSNIVNNLLKYYDSKSIELLFYSSSEIKRKKYSPYSFKSNTANKLTSNSVKLIRIINELKSIALSRVNSMRIYNIHSWVSYNKICITDNIVPMVIVLDGMFSTFKGEHLSNLIKEIKDLLLIANFVGITFIISDNEVLSVLPKELLKLFSNRIAIRSSKDLSYRAIKSYSASYIQPYSGNSAYYHDLNSCDSEISFKYPVLKKSLYSLEL